MLRSTRERKLGESSGQDSKQSSTLQDILSHLNVENVTVREEEGEILFDVTNSYRYVIQNPRKQRFVLLISQVFETAKHSFDVALASSL